ncbi:MAG: alpha/beta fold hydrolase [Bacteroidales bacterium]|jgi:pimeloyl-ACP methyl ester carboxylesterase|nr:alpha/beta fold hydrolase [Bacteroidales bacterium]
MKRLILLFAIATSAVSYSQNKMFFEATLEFNYTKLPVTIEYEKVKADTLRLLFGSPSQTDSLFLVDKAYLKGDSILFQLQSMGVVYRGKFNESFDTINGTFRQGVLSVPLLFVKKAGKFTYNRPQTPEPPFNYIVEEITFTNPKVPKYTFKGTLTKPKRGRNFPCVILISGSGIQNRDSEVFGHKPFAVLADHLTTCGIAVFRFDDRGYKSSDTSLLNATTFDYVSDVEAAIKMIKQQANIDSTNIGLIGHSEGALIAQIIASKDTSLKFIILMAGQGLKGRDVLTSQLKAITIAEGITDEDVLAQRLEEQRKAIDSKQSPKWLKTYCEIDPKDYLPLITQPTLVLQGMKDVQVVPDANMSAISENFGTKVGNGSLHIKTFSDDNHLFQRCKTGLPSEYGEINLTIDLEVLHHIQQFIREKVKK